MFILKIIIQIIGVIIFVIFGISDILISCSGIKQLIQKHTILYYPQIISRAYQSIINQKKDYKKFFKSNLFIEFINLILVLAYFYFKVIPIAIILAIYLIIDVSLSIKNRITKKPTLLEKTAINVQKNQKSIKCSNKFLRLIIIQGIGILIFEVIPYLYLFIFLM